MEQVSVAQIGPSAVIRLRKQYNDTWGHEWPHCDRHLSVLWFETKEACGVPQLSKHITDEVWSECLMRMREDDTTPARAHS